MFAEISRFLRKWQNFYWFLWRGKSRTWNRWWYS
jgi:hypothetical protein